MAQNRSPKTYRGYTVRMLRRMGLLAILAAVLALLGASIVLAQQGIPGGENMRVVAPQATPDGPGAASTPSLPTPSTGPGGPSGAAGPGAGNPAATPTPRPGGSP